MALAHEESNRDHLRGGERTDSHHDNSHHHHHGGGHAAKHEVEHRVVEKTGLAAAERMVDTAMEKAGERVVGKTVVTEVERGLELGIHHGYSFHRTSPGWLHVFFERIFTDGVEEAGERLVERGISTGLKRGFKRGVNKGLQKATRTMAERSQPQQTIIQKFPWVIFRRNLQNIPLETQVATPFRTVAFQAMKILRVLVPCAGTVFVAFMARDDYRRARKEWKQHRIVLATVLFCLAAMCDGTDTLVHAAVVLSMTAITMDRHLVHHLESIGLKCACVAMACMVVGELVSAGIILPSWQDRVCCRRNPLVKRTGKASEIHVVALH